MAERYRGTSPTHSKVKTTPEADEANKKAKAAFSKRNKKNTSIYSEYGYHIVIGGFIVLVLLAFANTFFSKSRNPDVTPVIEEDEIAAHNSRGFTFKLGPNDQFNQMMLSDAKNILNVQLTSRKNLKKCPDITSNYPEVYNFREAHPRCGSQISSQGKCSASYALTVASTISDRICQQSKETEIVHLSAQPLISCDAGFSLGCQGGHVSRGFDYAKKNGLVETSCQEYNGTETSDCKVLEKCKNYKIQDQCIINDEEGIKREIFTKGPVIAVLPVYRDFLVYKEGIYEVIEGVSNLRSGQAIKIIGWGKDEQSGRNFWLIENSWGRTWGENGYGRIYAKQPLNIDDLAIAPILNEGGAQGTQQQTN